MRKRLRKKKRIGEFQELGVDVAATLQVDVDFDVFLDDFIRSAVEANGLAFGGGGAARELTGFLELGRVDVHGTHLAIIAAWLAADPRVLEYQLGTPIDAWQV